MRQGKIILSFILPFIIYTSGFSQVNVEKFRLLKGKNSTSLDLNTSVSLAKGNTEIFNFDLGSGIYHKRDKTQFFLKGVLSFGKKNEEKFINKGFLHLRGLRSVSDRLSTEIFLQAEFNEFILLKNRVLGGSGIRYKAYEKPDLSFFVGFGLMYESERFSERNNLILKDDTKHLKMSSYISLNCKISETASLGVVTYYQVRISRFPDYRFLSNIILKLKISGNLSFNTTMNHRYDNSPPLTIKKYDLTMKSGLSLTL